MTPPMYLPTFFVRQRFAMMTNRYELYAAHPDGSSGQLYGLAEQKKFAFKEQVTFFSDDTKTRPVFGFKARKAIDLNAGYDVTDESGHQIGFFRKDFGASLLRSTFHVEGPGYVGTGQERSQLVALIRRFLDIPFLPIHFDFVDPAGRRSCRSSGRPVSATATPSTCPTRGSTSASPRPSRSASTP